RVRVIEDGHTGERWAKLLEQLQPTVGQFRRRIGDSCHVAAGFLESSDRSRRDCVRAEHDDWDCARRLLRSVNRLIPHGEHDVALAAGDGATAGGAAATAGGGADGGVALAAGDGATAGLAGAAASGDADGGVALAAGDDTTANLAGAAASGDADGGVALAAGDGATAGLA